LIVGCLAFSAIGFGLSVAQPETLNLTLDQISALAMSSEEFTELTGCEAVWEDVNCKGKDGKTYSYADKI
jgi:hypothetical protein